MATLIDHKQLDTINSLKFENLDHSEKNKHWENAKLTINTLYEAMNQNSNNSSQPPSSNSPWTDSSNESSHPTKESEGGPQIKSHSESNQHNRADVRKKREKGYGRHQKLKVDNILHLQATACMDCGHHIPTNHQKCYTAFYQIDLQKREGDGDYYHVMQTKFMLYDSLCEECGAITRATLPQVEQDGIQISRQSLVGPTLASLLIRLQKQNGTSLQKIKETIEDLYGLKLSKGAICSAINHGGVCCEDQVALYRREAEEASLAYMDETTWQHCGKTVWIWIVVTLTTCLVMMGRRTKEMALSFLNGRFHGWLMSDGYRAYREYKKRFRCWAHLIRKCKGLSESQLPAVSQFGAGILSLLNACMSAIYNARSRGDSSSVVKQLTDEIDKIEQLCLANKDSEHSKTKKLAREFLNDWEAIFRILDYPDFPLTNNEAERAIRHWVILRKVLIGTQSEKGKRATCAIASMIGTGKRRAENFIQTIKNCIQDKLAVFPHVTYKKIIRSG